MDHVKATIPKPSIEGASLRGAEVSVLVEQYRLYVEMMDKIADRRQHANSFFFSLSAGLFAAIAYLYSKDTDESLRSFTWVIALLGAPVSLFWNRLIESYRNLSTAKFEVIHEIERYLPFTPYATEWIFLERGRNRAVYLPLTHLEVWVPRFFGAAFLGLALWAFPWVYCQSKFMITIGFIGLFDKMFSWLNSNADAVQTLLAIMASAAAGFWAILWVVLRRENYPKANVDLMVDSVSLGDSGHLLRISLNVSNVGPNVIRLRQVNLHVQQIMPVPLIKRGDSLIDFDFTKSDGWGEYDWPALFSEKIDYKKGAFPEFEPCESGFLPFDFRLDKNVDLPTVIAVYAHVENVSKNRLRRALSGRKQSIGWTVSKIITLSHDSQSQQPAAAS